MELYFTSAHQITPCAALNEKGRSFFTYILHGITDAGKFSPCLRRRYIIYSNTTTNKSKYGLYRMSETENKSKCHCSASIQLLTDAKCNGGLPGRASCDFCRRHSLGCKIDEESDGRRKISSKRKIESLEQDRALLIELVESLHDDNETGLKKTIQIIRGGASLARLQLHLIEHRGLDCIDANLVAQGEADPGKLHGLGTGSRRECLEVKNIIE